MSQVSVSTQIFIQDVLRAKRLCHVSFSSHYPVLIDYCIAIQPNPPGQARASCDSEWSTTNGDRLFVQGYYEREDVTHFVTRWTAL